MGCGVLLRSSCLVVHEGLVGDTNYVDSASDYSPHHRVEVGIDLVSVLREILWSVLSYSTFSSSHGYQFWNAEKIRDSWLEFSDCIGYAEEIFKRV